MAYPFSREMRLRKRADFQRVFDALSSVADDVLVVYAVANKLDRARLGACVSRKHGNAVRRNQWKRLIRESFRVQQDVIPKGFDYVVLPRRGATPQAAAVARSLVSLTQRLVRRWQRSQQTSRRSET